ncbi:hypothetical protein BSKO_02294 [Bryopsis sp. KO-2023]|nr:hypothetical protein BSKO_02294 [Bryopsis sp. KO-2023]
MCSRIIRTSSFAVGLKAALARNAPPVAALWCGMRPQCSATLTELSKPVEPGPEDCCQSGCARCVWEIYLEDLNAYQRHVQEKNGEPLPVDPFLEFERQLEEKQRAKKS